MIPTMNFFGNKYVTRDPPQKFKRFPIGLIQSYWKRKDPLMEMFLIKHKPIVGAIDIYSFQHK